MSESTNGKETVVYVIVLKDSVTGDIVNTSQECESGDLLVRMWLSYNSCSLYARWVNLGGNRNTQGGIVVSEIKEVISPTEAKTIYSKRPIQEYDRSYEYGFTGN